MIKAVYPGSFDPVTFGHLDIITRASKVVDELIIGVLINQKKKPLFTMDERLHLLQEATKEFPTVEFAKENNARLIIRGLRAVTDFEYEMQLAQINHSVDQEIDTMFFTTSLEYAFLSSTLVKEFAYYGSDTTRYVPEVVAKALKEKFPEKENPLQK